MRTKVSSGRFRAFTIAAVMGVAMAVGCGDDGDPSSPNTGGSTGKGGSGGSIGDGGADTTGSGSGGKGGSTSSGSGGSDGGSGGDPTGTGGSGDGGGGGDPVVSSCAADLPSVYPGDDYQTNAYGSSDVNNLVTAMATLLGSGTGLMALAELPVTTTPVSIPTAAEMLAVFQDDDPAPSLYSVSTPAFRSLAAGIFVEHEDASNATWDGTPEEWEYDSAPSGQGGIWQQSVEAGRIFNENAIETRQIVDKGSFAGVFYAYALELASDGVTPAEVDAIARALGVNQTGTGPYDPLMPIAPDVIPTGTYSRSANYAHQVGLMAPIKDALIRARTYAGDADCSAELQRALTDLFRGWERGLVGRTIHYLQQAAVRADAGGTSFEMNAGMHQLGEGLGLILGLRGIPGKIISDQELEDVLALYLVEGLPVTAYVRTHHLLGADLDDLEDALESIADGHTLLQSIYGFTNDQMTNFKAASPTAG